MDLSPLDKLKETAASAAAAVANPMSVASKTAGIDLGSAAMSGASADLLGLYESNKTMINSALGMPDAASDYMDDFSGLLGGDTAMSGLSSAISGALSSEVAMANTVMDTASKAATASASATQALACLNIDLPDITGMVSDLWSTMGSYLDQATSFIGDAFQAGADYISGLIGDFNLGDFDLTNIAWLQSLYDKAQGCYRALKGMADKVKDFVTSSALFKTFTELAKNAIDLAHQCIGAVIGALSCGPEVMTAIGDGAAVLAAYNPSMMNALNTVNDQKASLLEGAMGEIDITDNVAVDKLLGSKTGEIFANSKRAVMDASGMGAATAAVSSAKDGLLSKVSGFSTSFSF